MTRRFTMLSPIGVLIIVFFTFPISKGQAQTRRSLPNALPRPAFSGLHIGMPEDSAYRMMGRIAVRSDTLHVDSLVLLESDSVRFFGQPAYVQVQIVQKRVKTIVINWHPLGGSAYTGLRDVLVSYLERF